MLHGAIWFLALFSLATQASVPIGGPRKGAGQTDLFGCLQTNDYYALNFTAYPADLKILRERKSLEPWCQDLPHPGPTAIAIDLLDRDLRHKPVALRITDAQGQVLAQTPPKVAPNGVVQVVVDLPAVGQYQAAVLVFDDELKIPPESSALHIPLSVGLRHNHFTPQKLMLGLIGIVAALGFGLGVFLPKLLRAKPAITPTC